MKSYFLISAIVLSFVSVSHARSLTEIAAEKAEKKKDYLADLLADVKRDAKMALRNHPEKENIEIATGCDLHDSQEKKISSNAEKEFTYIYRSMNPIYIENIAYDLAVRKAKYDGYSVCSSKPKKLRIEEASNTNGDRFFATVVVACSKSTVLSQNLYEDERVAETCKKIKLCSQKLLKGETKADKKILTKILVTADADYKCGSL